VALICDTGPLYAAMDRSDEDHASCAALLANSDESLVVPAPVVVELDWLSSTRLGPKPFLEFLGDVADGVVEVADLTRSDLLRVRDLLLRYQDLQLGFVDAAVVAVVERLGEEKLATLDRRHFSVIRPRHTESLELLPA
jgi:uncharacterized protein